MKSETRNKLNKFIKRADRIESYHYLDNPIDMVGGNITKEGDKWYVEFYQPEDEKREAILFHLRFFIHDKDGISIRKLADLYNDPCLSDECFLPLLHTRNFSLKYLMGLMLASFIDFPNEEVKPPQSLSLMHCYASRESQALIAK